MMNSSTAICAQIARAKINLALHITGKRADGYHELDSLVVFAEVGDQISATAADTLSLRIQALSIQGFGATTLLSDPSNSVLAAADALLQYANTNRLDQSCAGAGLVLEKNLPVSAGIGGGSADAAATLRALNVLWGLHLPQDVLETIGTGLGADVAVCVGQRSSHMRGIGENLAPLKAEQRPRFELVLANPGLPVSTPQVFHALENADQSALPPFPRPAGHETWLSWLNGTRNDLYKPACKLCPEIGTVTSELEQQGAQISRMSGSGGTCFGIFDNQDAAETAAHALQETHPDWWICATRTT